MIAQITSSESNVSTQSAPYFERNNFLKEEVTVGELSSIHNLGLFKMTEQDLLETKIALNVIGYNPATKLVNMMIENQILAIAKPGIDNHPHLSFLITLLPKLKKEAGATHLALALPRAMQKLLDVFIVTGEIFPTLCPLNLADYGLAEENDFVALLHAARLSGYQLLAVEPDTQVLAFDPEHEQKIAHRLITILQVQAQAKIVFIAPDKHLSCVAIGEWIPVAGILKEEGIQIQTVNQFWHAEFMPKMLACLLQGLIRPISLASKDVKMFAALQGKPLPLEYIFPVNWDLTIIYPKLSVTGKKMFKNSLNNVGAAIYRFLSQVAVS